MVKEQGLVSPLVSLAEFVHRDADAPVMRAEGVLRLILNVSLYVGMTVLEDGKHVRSTVFEDKERRLVTFRVSPLTVRVSTSYQPSPITSYLLPPNRSGSQPCLTPARSYSC